MVYNQDIHHEAPLPRGPLPSDEEMMAMIGEDWHHRFGRLGDILFHLIYPLSTATKTPANDLKTSKPRDEAA